MQSGSPVEIYTDGCCLINPGGPGGYAAIILTRKYLPQKVYGSHPSTTNNRMEMMGAIVGLERLSGPSVVTLYSDSQILINGAGGKWRRKKNQDLWKRLHKAAIQHTVTWQWIKGHAGNEWNEEADRIATFVANFCPRR